MKAAPVVFSGGMRKGVSVGTSMSPSPVAPGAVVFQRRMGGVRVTV
jgi:hypothetical protein